MKNLLFVLGLATIVISPIASAEEDAALAVNIGAFNAFDGDGETAAEFGLEYRFKPLASFYNLIPAAGLNANSDGSYWAHAGIRYDWQVSPSWFVTPNFAVVGFEQGGGLDMGHGLQFKTGVEIAYQFEASRLGLGIYHMSNASLGDHNPGEESVYLSYSFNLGN